MKIKKGMIVRCKMDRHDQFTKGKEYTVRAVRKSSVDVVEDDSGRQNGWLTEYFEAAPSSPIRTRREIVDGTYGIASISTYDETRCRIGLEKNILTAEDFRELAHLANQIAEVMEENQ